MCVLVAKAVLRLHRSACSGNGSRELSLQGHAGRRERGAPIRGAEVSEQRPVLDVDCAEHSACAERGLRSTAAERSTCAERGGIQPVLNGWPTKS